jgi:hypothetical protein
MAGSGRKAADDVLALALAAGATVADAARQAGVSERTVYRRLDDTAFRWRVTHTRASFVSQTVGLLADAMTDAARTLRDLLTADSDAVRLGAARAILDAGVRLRESEELAERIAVLEAHLEPNTDAQARERMQWRA